MASSPLDTSFNDKKDIANSSNGLPSPVVSLPEYRQPSRAKRVISCIFVGLAVLLIGHHCQRYFPLRSAEQPQQSSASADGPPVETGMLQVEGEIPTEVPQALEATTWHRPIFMDRVIIYPTDEVCLNQWETVDSNEATPFATPSGDRQFRATNNFTLRRDVHTYIMGAEFDQAEAGAQLHVVPGSGEHTVVTVDAFYDEPATLDPFSACTFHADETEELLSRHSWIMYDSEGNTTDKEHKYDPESMQRSDVFRLQLQRRQDANKSESLSHVWFNITLSIPSVERAYSLRIEDLDVDFHGGLTLDNVAARAKRIYTHESFKAGEVSMDVYGNGEHDGLFGHITSSGNISIGASYSPVNVHIESTHSLVHKAQTVNLFSFDSPLNATLSLTDPARKARNSTFEIQAISRNGPLDLTLCDESTYASVTIDAQAHDAPAHLSLDNSFEGTFIAKTMESDDSEKARAVYGYGELYPGYARVFRAPLRTRHVHAGAVGWGSEDAAVNGRSFAEVRSVKRSATIDV